ncbi:MAG: hypothetical protein ACK5AL_14565 [Planctomycetota bacterium]|jgi:hypothetical protein
MQTTPSPGRADTPEPPPPLGSWRRTYAATIALALVVIALLWLLTALGNVPLGSAR